MTGRSDPLRAVLLEADAGARSAGRLIGALSPRFCALVDEVSAVVGGSAQRVDHDMIAVLVAARDELGRAEALLHECSRQLTRVITGP